MHFIKLFPALLLVFITQYAGAQVISKCGIWFDYDAAGNRVKRYNDCKTIDLTPVTPNPGNSLRRAKGPDTSSRFSLQRPTVVPNPTAGPYTITLPTTGDAVHFHWYDAKGSIIASGDFTGISFSSSIAAFPPGDYVLALRWNDMTYIYRIVKQN